MFYLYNANSNNINVLYYWWCILIQCTGDVITAINAMIKPHETTTQAKITYYFVKPQSVCKPPSYIKNGCHCNFRNVPSISKMRICWLYGASRLDILKYISVMRLYIKSLHELHFWSIHHPFTWHSVLQRFPKVFHIDAFWRMRHSFWRNSIWPANDASQSDVNLMRSHSQVVWLKLCC